MDATQFENRTHVNYDLRDISVKVDNITDDALSSAGPNLTLKIEAHPVDDDVVVVLRGNNNDLDCVALNVLLSFLLSQCQ